MVYQDQYPLFGNHQVMPVKILWDYMIYWTLTGYLFFHGRICDPLSYPPNIPNLKRISDLNHFLQKFFREWHKQSEYREVGGMINMSTIPLIFDTNKALQDDLSRREFSKRFSENAAQVEALFWEIVDRSEFNYPIPFRRRPRAIAKMSPEGHFAQIFEAVAEPKNSDNPIAVNAG